MNPEIFSCFETAVPIICYGMLTWGFSRFLKTHLESTKRNRRLFALILFAGFLLMDAMLERGGSLYGMWVLLRNFLFAGLVILAFLGAWEKKLLAAAVLLAEECLTVNFCSSFLTFLTLVFGREILKQPVMLTKPWQDDIITLLSYFLAAAFLGLLSKKSAGFFEGKTEKWYLMTAGPLFFVKIVMDAYNWCVSRGVLFWGGENKDLYENQLFSYGAVCVLTALLMLAAGFYVYGMNRIYLEWQKNEAYRIRTAYLESLKEQNKRMDKIRHDMKNHIISMQGLLAGGDLERLKSYLDKLAKTGGLTETEEITGSRALDALLYEKQKQAKEHHIRWQCDMQPWKKSTLDEFDFCVLAGNGLDNAIAACKKMKTNTNRFVHIQTGRVKNYFLFEIKNSAPAKDLCKKQKPGPADNHKLHGIGLLNIRETVEKYHGIMNTELKDGTFILSILIPAEESVSEERESSSRLQHQTVLLQPYPKSFLFIPRNRK